MDISKPVTWGNFTPDFLDGLATKLRGHRVLEIFAGNGFLAAEMARRGVSVTATSLFSGHDGHTRGMWFDVIEMHALQAVRELGDGSDVLLMSWPTVTEAAAAAVLAWGCERDVIFIGEMTDYVRGHLGGCATDAFFEMTEVMSVIESYEPGNVLERAVVLRTRPEYIHTTQATDFR